MACSSLAGTCGRTAARHCVEPRPCLQLLPHCIALSTAVLCSCLPCTLGVLTAVVLPHQFVEPTAWHFAGSCRPAASDCKTDSVALRRPEMKFDGMPALIARIRADIGVAKVQLGDPALAELAHAPLFE